MKGKTQSISARKRKKSRLSVSTISFLASGALTIAIVVVVIVITSNNYAVQNTPIEGIQFFPGLSATHVEGAVNYPQIPPAGGPHNQVWQNCGVYTEPVLNEHAVHSLEHGAVWITYQASLPVEQVQTLQNITMQGDHRLLSPYPSIDSPIVLSAWAYQLKLTDANDPRLMAFIRKYENGPTTPEQNGYCTGGELRTRREITGQ